MSEKLYSQEAEVSVIGGCWIKPDAFDDVAEVVSPEDFHVQANRIIFRAMRRLRNEGNAPDPVAVRDRLVRDNDLEAAGGEDYMAGIVDVVSTAQNLMQHARIVADYSVRRSVVMACDNIRGRVGGGGLSAQESLEVAESEIFGIVKRLGKPTALKGARDMTRDVVAQIMAGPPRAFGTGFPDLDYYINGFRPRELTVLAARPSMGKTGMALQMAAHAAVREKKRVAIFSLEMGDEDALKRIVSIVSGVEVTRIMQGPPEFSDDELERIDRTVGRVEGSELYIDGTAALSGFDVRARSRRLARKGGLDLIVVDYLQRMRGKSNREANRNVEIGGLIQDLKSAAKELECSVLCLSQLSRRVEDRNDKMPVLSDLRESGDIEQEADRIIMMYRPGYYMAPNDAAAMGADKVTEVSVSKNRNGPTGRLKLCFHAPTASFTSYQGGFSG